MTALARYDAACRALGEARDLDEVKDIADKAEAMRAYARQAKDIELETAAAEIKLRAQRRLGEMSAALETAPPGPAPAAPPTGDTSRQRDISSKRDTLKAAGISKSAAHRYERTAEIPSEVFERILAEKRDRKQPAHAGDLVKAARRDLRRCDAAQAEGAARTDTVADLTALADSGRKFGAIYADPAWNHQTYSDKGKDRSAERHYDTMTQAGIEAMGDDIKRLAATDCVLFLWSVRAQLPQALRVIEAWGFTFKTRGFTWIKLNKSGQGYHMGMGKWTRANPETCLLAAKGAPPRLNDDVRELVIAPVGDHSAKPDSIAGDIERLVAGPYLELNARRPRKGWTVWGNQSAGDRGQRSEGAAGDA